MCVGLIHGEDKKALDLKCERSYRFLFYFIFMKII